MIIGRGDCFETVSIEENLELAIVKRSSVSGSEFIA